MEVIIGRVDGINTSDNVLNILVTDSLKKTYNIKASLAYKANISQGTIYKFNVEKNGNKNILCSIDDIKNLDDAEIVSILHSFGNSSPLSYDESVKEINKYLNKIDSKIIYDITKYLLDKFHKDFFIYPAAAKMHHAYVGGLSYHTIGMLRMADSFLLNYPYLNKNYLYAGIILHDIGKTTEFNGIQNTDYSLKGQLIGHLVIGGMEVNEAARVLHYEDTEEALILEHMLISHHGQPQFGAAKRPMTAEALVLWYIDTIDSKFRVLGDELDKIKPGEYTDQIGVLDRVKVYKTK